jgi:hypothetical protein
MNINPIGINFGTKVIKPKVQNLKQIKEIEEELPDFFRDRELFDPAKDRVTTDYLKYQKDDFPIHVTRHDPAYDLISRDSSYMSDDSIIMNELNEII